MVVWCGKQTQVFRPSTGVCNTHILGSQGDLQQSAVVGFRLGADDEDDNGPWESSRGDCMVYDLAEWRRVPLGVVQSVSPLGRDGCAALPADILDSSGGSALGVSGERLIASAEEEQVAVKERPHLQNRKVRTAYPAISVRLNHNRRSP